LIHGENQNFGDWGHTFFKYCQIRGYIEGKEDGVKIVTLEGTAL